MATFTWIGTSGNFSQPHFWEIGGSVTSAVPGSLDVALFDGSAAYVVTVGSAIVQSLLIGDPAATLDITGQIFANVTLANAGLIAVGTGTADAALGAEVFANSGSIAIASQGTVTIGSYDSKYHIDSGTYANTGAIAVAAGGTLVIAAHVATVALGTVAGSGTLLLAGEIDNAGATLAAIPGGTLAVGGILAGGTLDTTQGPVVIVDSLGYQGFYQPTTLDAVSVLGTLDVTGMVEFRNGVTLVPGAGSSQATIELDRGPLQLGLVYTPAELLFHTDQALHDVVLHGKAGSTTLHTDGTLTLGSGVSITAAGTISIDGTGALATTAALTLAGPAWIAPAAVGNSGTLIAAIGGDVSIAAPLANSGTLLADGGSLNLAMAVSGSGSIALANAGTATLGAGYAGQSFAFAAGGGTLRLGNAGGTVTISGFAPGDTIELVNTPASVTYDNGTLSTFVGGSFPLASFVLAGGLPNAQFSVTTDAGDDTFITETIPCFAEGTRLAGPHGEVSVELVRPGDRLRSAFGGLVEVVWVGHRRVQPRRWADPAEAWPIRIRRGALRPDVPARDLRLSPEHGVLLDGALVPAKFLVDGITILQESCEAVTYWHIELPQHDVLLAEGAPCESYLDTGNRGDFTGEAQPDADADAIWRARACLPQRRDAAAGTRMRAAMPRHRPNG